MFHHKGMCGCGHHIVAKVLVLLAWVSGILFFWTSLKGVAVWGFDAGYYAWVVVILTLLTGGLKHCGCCWKKMMMSKMEGQMAGEGMMCKHGEDCKCGDCERCK